MALIPQVDITSPLGAQGLNLDSVAHLGQTLLVATPENYKEILDWVTSNFSRFTISVDVSELTITSNILTLLDAGVARVFVQHSQLEQLRPDIPSARVVQILDMAHGNFDFTDTIARTPMGIFAKKVNNLEGFKGWLKGFGEENRPSVYVSFDFTPTMEDVKSVIQLFATPIVPTELLTVDTNADESALSVAKVLCAAVTTDRPDGLLTTLVVDERGVGLGLVYSSEKSVAETLRTGRGVYHSRKRGLWYKGETSGATQELVKIDLDCDGDCLRFVVKQKGAGEMNLPYY